MDRTEYMRAYYLKNAERIAQRQKEYHLKNAERIAQHKKEYRRKNAKRIADYLKVYRRKNAKRTAEWGAKHQREYRRKLGAGYVRSIIKQEGFPCACAEEVIDAKRMILALKRAVKEAEQTNQNDKCETSKT